MLRSLALGAAIGGVAVIAIPLVPDLPGLSELTRLAELCARLGNALNASVGPVWLPMSLVALRVGWLAGRALRSRRGRHSAAPVGPELGQLAPLFAVLGLCGTVWGLGTAFDALGDGQFLSRVPSLLAGLGAAMTSTLLGLGLQISTLLVAAFNPVWSQARVESATDDVRFALDGRELGAGTAGLDELVRTLRARQPEALRVELARGVSEAWRTRIHDTLWRRLDSAIPIREISG